MSFAGKTLTNNGEVFPRTIQFNSNNKIFKSPASVPTENRSKHRQALPQILAVCAKNMLLLNFGMTLGFPTILIPSLSSNDPDEPFHLDSEAISWIGSINLICVPVGGFLSGSLTQMMGRKRAMQIVNLPFIAAWLLFHFSDQVWQVFLALALTGLTGGLLEAPVLTYVAEITQPHLRGILSSTSSMSVIFGTMLQFVLGTFLHWRTVVLINCTVPILAFISLIFVPETPVWLISKNRYLEARNSLAWLRGWTSLDEIEAEFQDLCKQLGKDSNIGTENQNHGIFSGLKLLTKKSFLWPYSLVTFTFFLCHFNGMATLQTYAIKIFATLESPINEYYATIILGVIQLLGTILCVTLIHFTGKRAINFVSLLGAGCCFTIVGIYAYLFNVNYLEIQSNNSTINPEDEHNPQNWLPTTFLILSAFLSQFGIRSLPWLLIGEVFSNETRAHAAGFAGAGGYILNFLSNKIFLQLVATLTLPATFWLYAIVGFIGTIVLFFSLPETEGKTLHNIAEHFAGNLKLDNKVLRKTKAGVVNLGFVDD